MVANRNENYISPEEYLQAEEISPVKHEYIDGQVYAMADANDPHVTLVGNLFTMLRSHVRGKGLRAYVSAMKLHIESRNIYYYPDGFVSGDERDRAFQFFKRYPCLVVEVLSRKTEAFDRGDKFADYREIETLQEYVLISQKRQRVECFRRNAEGQWVLYSYNQGSEVYLASVDFRISIDALYEDVVFTDEEPQEESN